MYKNKFNKYSVKTKILRGGHLDKNGKNIICDVCMTNNIQLLFTSCGHCVCQECYAGGEMTKCHLCREHITNIIFIPEEHLDKEMDWFIEKIEKIEKIERYKTITGRPHVIYRDVIRPAEMDHLTEMAIRDGDVVAAADTDDRSHRRFLQQQRLQQITLIHNGMRDLIRELTDLKDSSDTRRREIALYFKPITSEIDYWCDLLDQKFEKQRIEGISLSDQISFCKAQLAKLVDKLSNIFAEYEEFNERYSREVHRFMRVLTERGHFHTGLTFEDITRLPMILGAPSVSYSPSPEEIRRYLEKSRQYLQKIE